MEVQLAVAPLRGGHGVEGVPLDGGHHLRIHGVRRSGDPERAIAAVPPRPAGDLTHFVRVQRALSSAVELGEACEGHMVYVHVQAHPDRVGGDKEIDFAGLIESDLCIAGAGESEPITTAAPPR